MKKSKRTAKSSNFATFAQDDPSSSKSTAGKKNAMLVNKLSIGDAQHMVRNEGGPLTLFSVLSRVTIIALVAGFAARAIYRGHATATHLILPSVTEYFVLLFAIPLLALIVPDPAIRKEVKGSVILLIFFAVVLSGWVTYQSKHLHKPWPTAFENEMTRFWDWIFDHQMHLPMLGAAIGILLALPGRVRMLKKHGPPFFAVSLGCGMRIVVLIFGACLIPIIAGSSVALTWGLWTVLVLAELGSIFMHWDMQKRLQERGVEI